MRAGLANAALLRGPVLRRRRVAADALLVEAHTPAAAPDAVVPLDERREVRPAGFVQRSHVKARHRFDPRSRYRRYMSALDSRVPALRLIVARCEVSYT